MAEERIKLSPSEQLAYSTVRIEVMSANGTGTGTGFFFSFLLSPSQNVPVIVTNKHVVRGARQGKIILTGTKPDGYPDPSLKMPAVFNNFESMWVPHPDSAIDLTVMPLAPILTEANARKFNPFLRWFDRSIIPSEDALKQLTAVEDILMIGYPVGIWDEVNNYPIFRKGITATHPAYKYAGRDEFMIDAACFPGSSGSPVLLFNVGSYAHRDGGTVIGTRIILLGVLYGGPQYNVKGEITIVPIPERQDVAALSRIPMNLGNVIRSSRLLDFDTVLQNLVNKGGNQK